MTRGVFDRKKRRTALRQNRKNCSRARQEKKKNCSRAKQERKFSPLAPAVESTFSRPQINFNDSSCASKSSGEPMAQPTFTKHSTVRKPLHKSPLHGESYKRTSDLDLEREISTGASPKTHRVVGEFTRHFGSRLSSCESELSLESTVQPSRSEQSTNSKLALSFLQPSQSKESFDSSESNEDTNSSFQNVQGKALKCVFTVPSTESSTCSSGEYFSCTDDCE